MPALELEGYCNVCKKMKLMTNPKATKLRNGEAVWEDHCKDCGSVIYQKRRE